MKFKRLYSNFTYRFHSVFHYESLLARIAHAPIVSDVSFTSTYCMLTKIITMITILLLLLFGTIFRSRWRRKSERGKMAGKQITFSSLNVMYTSSRVIITYLVHCEQLQMNEGGSTSTLWHVICFILFGFVPIYSNNFEILSIVIYFNAIPAYAHILF